MLISDPPLSLHKVNHKKNHVDGFKFDTFNIDAAPSTVITSNRPSYWCYMYVVVLARQAGSAGLHSVNTHMVNNLKTTRSTQASGPYQE